MNHDFFLKNLRKRGLFGNSYFEELFRLKTVKEERTDKKMTFDFFRILPKRGLFWTQNK